MVRRLSVAVVACALLAPISVKAAEPPLVEPQWLLDYTKGEVIDDFRPAVDGTGKRVVFERSIDNGNYNVMVADLATKKVKQLVGPNNRFGIKMSARADWCWGRGDPTAPQPIAFSVGNGSGETLEYNFGVYTFDLETNVLSFVPGTIAAIYPTWYPSCQALAVDAFKSLPYRYTSSTGSTEVVRGPQTQRLNPDNGALQKVLSGEKIWAGFANINRANPSLITFAGQKLSEAGYNENMNYVFIADTSADPPRVVPLDPKAPMNMFDTRFQGRAPSWSPDGKWIAFESNRHCGELNPNIYALYLQDAAGLQPAKRLTRCRYNGQHAKWYPAPVNGRTLIVASFYLHPASSDPAIAVSRGIGSLDVTDFITPPAAP